MSDYRRIRFGVEKVGCGDLARHRHREGYATVVLSGAFTEASFAGRFRAVPGTALLHDDFDCHGNVETSSRGPTVLRLPWRGGRGEGAFQVRDPDLLARLAESNVLEAAAALHEMIEPVGTAPACWSDELAIALRGDASLSLRDWAEAKSLSPSSVSRGFRDAYLVSPQRFRLEVRARSAWRKSLADRASLTSIAHELGFADLAHMSRSVTALTGASPNWWRLRGNKSHGTSRGAEGLADRPVHSQGF